jgi:carboxyl-terminal processing protease
VQSPYGRVLAGAMIKVENSALDPVGEPKLFERAMRGMLGQFDDYSTYLSPHNLAAFHKTVDLQFAGVGIEIAVDPKTKQLEVLSPVANSPASLAGDRIPRIGKTSTQGIRVRLAR